MIPIHAVRDTPVTDLEPWTKGFGKYIPMHLRSHPARML